MSHMQHGSHDDFEEVFSKRLTGPSTSNHSLIDLNAAWFNTPLGPMIAIANEDKLFLLEFFERRNLENGIERLQKHTQARIIAGKTSLISQIETEIAEYFAGNLTEFKTPYQVFGSLFQVQVWQALCQIPYGETRSYAEQAESMGKPSAYRAVANANGANRLAIIVPCHRIITSSGELGGYGGGISRKQELLKLEQKTRRML